MAHIMMGKGIAFKIEPSQGNNTGYSHGRSANHFITFPSGYSSFFITNDNDSSYMSNMFVSAGGYTLAGASANSVYDKLDDIIWSSWHFDYLEHKYVDDTQGSSQGNVILNSHAVQFSGGKDSNNIPYTTTQDYTIVSFSTISQTFSYPPLFTLKSSTYPSIGSQLILKYGNDSYRILTPYSSTTELKFREVVYVGNTAVPQLNLGNIQYNLIQTGSQASLAYDTDTNDLLINDSRVKIGEGKKAQNNQTVLFDSDKDYLQKNNSGDIEFYTETQIGAIVGSDTYSAGTENTFSAFAQTNNTQGTILMSHNPYKWNISLFLYKNGSIIYSESSKASPAITYRLQSGAMVSTVGNFQGNTIHYEI